MNPAKGRTMMNQNETLLSISQAARLLPPGREGKPVHPSTVLRWILAGSGGVRLEARRMGSRWVTSREALDRFSAALTARALGEPVAPTSTAQVGRGESDRARQERVEQALSEFGV
jgi:hypothetical protein